MDLPIHLDVMRHWMLPFRNAPGVNDVIRRPAPPSVRRSGWCRDERAHRVVLQWAVNRSTM